MLTRPRRRRLALRAWDERHVDAAEAAVRRAGAALLASSSLAGHSDNFSAVDVAGSAGDTRYLTTSFDGSAIVWNSAGGELLRLEGHTHAVIGGRFSPDGSMIVTWSDDRTIRTWDAVTGEPSAVIEAYVAYGGVDISNTADSWPPRRSTAPSACGMRRPVGCCPTDHAGGRFRLHRSVQPG